MANNKTYGPKFDPPEGWMPPETETPGKFDMVCSFQVDDDGKLCLTHLGDTPYKETSGDKRDKEAKEPKPDYSDYSRGIMDGMRSGMMG